MSYLLTAVSGAVIGSVATYVTQISLKASTKRARKPKYLSTVRFYLKQLVKIMAVAYYFPEEEAGNPDTELTELRKLAFSIEDDGAMTDQQTQTIEDVIDVVSDCVAYMKKERERLIHEPALARPAISATGRSGLTALHAARREFGFNDAVLWPLARTHQKWPVGATIPGSANNIINALDAF